MPDRVSGQQMIAITMCEKEAIQYFYYILLSYWNITE